ncbi:M1 family metallopeptidase [uncultured Dokdonia sp.]|uniref:M1 family metallopeptidase n=1 Tax=uncultured Dokdonia sp. TaxID=575653 RepID=UPI00260B2A7F|nr:M1 family metallopeptidase [uncultured Dokdonia sp.]
MKSILFFGSFLVCLCSYAQKLPMSLEFKKAYENETRSYTGESGNKYWQNNTSYDLKVKINPSNKLLQGTGKVQYINHSPESLNYILLHAYPNYYKQKIDSKDSEANKGMIIDEVKLQELVINLKDKNQFKISDTQFSLQLTSPLSSGDTLNIEYKWHYTIPSKRFRRSGAIDSTSMFIAYWYPEVAVFDDIHGWDNITYDATSEFYHDVANFKVEIEVPKNYMVWSSTELKNPSEIFPKKILNRLNKAKNSFKSITIIGKSDIGLEVNNNLWKYEVNKIPDFSFALSDHFIWEATSYKDEMGEYFLNIVYDIENSGFSTVLKAQQESLKLFHNKFPKYPFPYNNFTIFNGNYAGGMEFPGMANDDVWNGKEFSESLGYEISDYQANFGLTLHEMFHMYYPFLMGINEKRYGWMDEGWAEFAEYFSPELLKYKYDNQYITKHWVVPMMVPTYTRPKYSGINSYTISSFSYYSLYYLLGEETFNKCFKAFIERWKGKHPTPYDFFFTFNDVSGKDLNWFWNRWYFNFGYPDLKNDGIKDNKLTIINEGGLPLAFELIYSYYDGTKKTEIISPECWKNSDVFTKEILDLNLLESIELKAGNYTDALYSNNIWTKEKE